MDIDKKDVASVSLAGYLHDDTVKMVKTHGGLHILYGKRNKSSKKPEALAAASHPALATFELEKMYSNDFQPAIMKSEAEQLEKVTQFEAPNSLKVNNLQIFSLEKSNKVDFVVSRLGAILSKYECEIEDGKLKIKAHGRLKNVSSFLDKNSESIQKAIVGAIEEYSKKNGVELYF